ncbi:flagellar export chaperone FliS [Alteromonas mediterranea]|jgi:flagellar protein FliS|uniref:Flagellar secretion chaperone FliS n=1 Tax=Alteromonas mediterranea (strain DSM 17117 / CIP 110805 / LMG 28347 / Deep ecotype) TaxID=1774373 RepID=F2G375_ALTMD|nr:flagellar export chaperone FliS [Alteromonas mediterranea]AEA97299.2 flagellar protein FliS [Alteromonas mediterranea DE]CAH1206327.1 Flagellar secretion chaperone FliS [Alteromonas mediterranea]
MNGKIKHYQREALKTRLASADPFEVTQMLMEGALESMKIAKINIQNNDLENKSKFIAKATSIIDSLRLSLNHNVGGELSSNLESLYVYMSDSLLESSINNDIAKIEEVVELLSDIKVAWDQIPERDRQSAFNQMQNKTAVSG